MLRYRILRTRFEATAFAMRQLSAGDPPASGGSAGDEVPACAGPECE
jgi:hypothetical protein